MERLLCVISGMNAGGAETFLMKLYRTLDKTKYQMDFCVNIRERGFYDDEIERLGGVIYHIPCKSENLAEFRRQFTALIREQDYRCVFKISSSGAGFMDLALAKKAGAERCIVRSSNSSDGGGLRALLAHRLGRLLYERYIDVKLAPSDLAAEYTFGKRACRRGEVTILHNAVDLDLYRYDPEARSRIRAELGLSPQAKLIGHVGRFMTQKNHTFLLDVFAALHRQEPESVLLLVGGGELEQPLREKAAALGLTDAVCFAGVRRDVPALLSAMDVFVFPSLYEGMPNTVIEAQATGLPCVIADTITREAAVTDLVTYLPLSASADAWAQTALAACTPMRADTRAAFVAGGYEIEAVCRQFEKLVFGDNV